MDLRKINKRQALVVAKEVVQKVLAKKPVRRSVNRANLAAMTAISSSDLLSGVYGTLLTGSFLREQRAVYSGLRSYYRRATSNTANWALLRRNTHRLEKGLVLKPRRPVFALEYIEETVHEFVLGQKSGEDPSTLRWCEDILAAYFSAVEPSPFLNALKNKFERARQNGDACEQRFVPYIREETAGISFDQFAQLCRVRRSVRYFEQRPVPRELLDKAIEVSAQSPSACNRQPFRYRIFDEPERVSQVVSLPFGTAGYAENVPTVIVLTGLLDSFSSPRDRHLIYIDASLAAMTLMLALETLGLNSCPINWPDFGPLERKLSKALDLDADERPVMFLAVGFADKTAMIASSKKKSLDQLRTYED